jgi:hypothetical protein
MAFVPTFTPALPRALASPTIPATPTLAMRYGIDRARYAALAKGRPGDAFAMPPSDNARAAPTVDVSSPAGAGGYGVRVTRYAAMAAAGPASAYPGMRALVSS